MEIIRFLNWFFGIVLCGISFLAIFIIFLPLIVLACIAGLGIWFLNNTGAFDF